jgi:hypothetical protein
MKQKLLYYLLRLTMLCGLLLGFSPQAEASHVMGSDLTYTCIGPNQYQITLRVFRDCGGISMPSAFSINYTGCGNNGNVNVNIVSTSDITPLCPSQTSACSGGSSPIGVEQYIYQGTVTLPSGCNSWTLSTSTCCRNDAITNLSGPGSNSFYVSTTLNGNLASCNSSPVFSSPPAPFNCVNQTVIYQQLANDPDGDSLVYSLTNCRQDAATNVTYSGSFSGSNPLTVPVTINPATGEMIFTANTTQIAAICVLVEEFRNGVKIGEIIRDMQFVIQNCSNQLPVVSGINGVPNVYSITSCEGANLCFDVPASDINAGDNLTMSFVGSIPGSTFVITGTGSNRVGRFCWTPPVGSAGRYVFSVIVNDGACPIPGQGSRAYTINITPNPNPPVNAGADVGICAGSTTALAATSAAMNISSLTWSPATGLSTTNGANTNASPGATTNYTVTAVYSDGCTSSDDVQVTINAAPIANAGPTTANVCPGGAFQFTGSTNIAGMNYTWRDHTNALIGSGNMAGTSVAQNIIAPAAAGTYVFTFSVTHPTTGCSSFETVNVVVGAPPALPSCVNIYATPTGGSGAAGTQADPTNLTTALSRAACQNAVIKLSTGTHTIDNPLNLTSFVTIEGGFTAGTWLKSSAAGATVINRSTLNPEGAANAQRLVAFYGNSATGFRFQDVTIRTSAANQPGMSTYGVHLTNCSNYDFVRTQIQPGAAAAGSNGVNGGNGGNGTNGTTGGGPQCTCFGTDSGGSGGGGGAAGAGGANAALIGGSAGAGGAGSPGGNGRPDNTSAAGFAGTAGTAAASGGGGGTAGTGGNQDSNGNSTSNVGNGGVGGIGTAGTNGTAGASAYTLAFFVPGAGTNGTSGTGGGGGGGGGGAARDTDGCDAAGGGGSGGGGGGGGGAASRGFGGGGSFGLFLFNNGATGRVTDCNVVAGAAGAAGVGGTGGNGGNGGTSAIGNGCINGDSDGNRGGAGGAGGRGGNGGNGGAGSAGVSIAIHLASGTPLATNISSFNLAAQPTITATNINCTNTDVTFSGAATNWDYDVATNFAVPATAAAVGSGATQYTTMGRYSVATSTDTYTGFHNISFEGSIVPLISTNATQIGVDTFQLCQGQSAVFESVYFGEGYQWNFNGAIANPGNVRATASTAFTTPGFYPVTLGLITDCCGLSTLKTVYLFVDRLPTPMASVPAPICAGQSTTLTVSGLQATDNVVWSPSTGILSSTSNTITVAPDATTTYIATVFTQTTTNGVTRQSCPVNVTFPVTVNVLPTLAFVLTQPTCGSNGQVRANITAGAGNYNFVWSNGGSSFNATTSTIAGLAAGVYSVTATGATTGCTVTASSFLNPAPSSPVVFLQNSTASTCGLSNGTATVATSGGTAPFTYAWSTGGVGASRTNLAPGNYCVTVTDGNTCRSNVCFNITTPGAVAINLISSNNLRCNGINDGAAVVEATGGTGPYSYIWSNGATGTSPTNLPAGNSTVTATDLAGCSMTRTVALTTPSALTLVTASSGAICPSVTTGSVSVVASGGTAGYTYLWNPSGRTTTAVTGLAPNTYVVTVTDGNLCTRTATATIASIASSTPPSITGIPGTICPNTDVVLNATGGIAGSGSTILWYNGANGTGGLIGTGASITLTPTASVTVFARREGTCNVTSDATTTVNVKTYIYAANGTSTNTYCTDNAGWHHFFVGANIIYSVQGDISSAPAGFPVATIWNNSTYYQEAQGPFTAPSCINGWNPGEERFEMSRSWDFNMGGGAPSGLYNVRFYYQPAERAAIETAAINWMATYPACSYGYKYATPLGFYWFKNLAGAYTAPIYDATHYTASIGSTVNSINYSEWAAVPSFSGGSGAVIIVPTILLSGDWKYFTGDTDGRVNHLHWATAQEENTAYFEVQRSQNGIDYQPIGRVAAKGFSAEESTYNFDDNAPFTGLNYYRLRLVDNDGSADLSNIVALNIERDGQGYSFFPNPTQNVVVYQFNSQMNDKVELQVIDVLGRTLQTQQMSAQTGFNQLEISLGDYPNATYIIRAKHLNSGNVHTAPIIKKND